MSVTKELIDLITPYALGIKTKQLTNGWLVQLHDVTSEDAGKILFLLHEAAPGVFCDISFHAKGMQLAITNKKENPTKDHVAILATELAEAGINFPGSSEFLSRQR